MNLTNNTASCLQELDSFHFYTKTRKVNIAVTAIIIIVGLIGNGLAVFVFAQRRFRSHSSSIYLLFLCLSDGLFLLMHFFEDILRTYIDVYTKPETKSISPSCHYVLKASDQNDVPSWFRDFLTEANITDRFDLACGLVNYLRYFLRFVSAYVIIAFTVQRTLAIYSPFFQAKFSSKTLAWTIAIMLVIIGLVLNIWVPFLFKIDQNDEYCDIHREYSSYYFVITNFYITLIMFIPIVVIFVCNTLIIYYVLKASKLRLGLMNVRRTTNVSRPSPTPSNISRINGQNLGVEEINLLSRSGSMYTSPYASFANGGRNKSYNFPSLKRPTGSCTGSGVSKTSSDSNHKITRMLLLMSFSYALLNLPYFMSWCVFFYQISSQKPSNTLKYNLFSAINLCEIFYVLNYGIHFFIYCASGRKFRELLRSAFDFK